MNYRPDHLCPVCGGVGVLRFNETRNPATGVWEGDEETCYACKGHGVVVKT